MKQREREPIISTEQNERFYLEKIYKQWELVSACVCREAKKNSRLRRSMLRFCTEPVSEKLAKNMLEEACKVSPRVDKLVERYKDSLVEYIGLNAVPDGVIEPDVINAARKQAINWEEYLLTSKRFEMARDVKRLALGAEILESTSFRPDKSGRMETSNGIKIYADTSKKEHINKLLNPFLWSKRIQIKDRVYAIDVQGKGYILKERKTKYHRHQVRRHEDLDIGGYSEEAFLSSADEYAVARYFESLKSVVDSNTSIAWEKPIGHVLFPDGFSFTMFEYRSNLVGKGKAMQEAQRKINNHQELYNDEYEKITKPEAEASYTDFAKVKAYFVLQMTDFLLRKHNLRRGFNDPDSDGYAFQLNNQNPRILFDMLAFDFERYEAVKLPQVQDPTESEDERLLRAHYLRKWLNSGINLETWPDGKEVTSKQKELYKTMIANENSDYEKIINELKQREEHHRKKIEELKKE